MVHGNGSHQFASGTDYHAGRPGDRPTRVLKMFKLGFAAGDAGEVPEPRRVGPLLDGHGLG